MSVEVDKATRRILARVRPDEVGALDHSTPDAFRRFLDQIRVLNGPGPAMYRADVYSVPGTPDDVRVRLLSAVEQPRALIVSLDLGGWASDVPNAGETFARKLAERTSAAVAVIDFRRSPEHPYPAPVDDVHAAIRWLWDARSDLGLDGLPLVLVGEGMGGSLAATVARRCRDDVDGPTVAMQVLVCPLTDAATSPPPADDNPVRGLLTRHDLDSFWAWYVPDPELRADPDVSPARIADLTGLPPTVLITAEHDPARDEGAAFADRLREAGVPVAYRHYEGQVSGVLGILAIPVGERVFQHVIRAVRGYTARFTVGADPLPPAAELGRWLDRIVK